MTISTTTSRVSYTGDGVTLAFPFPYKFTSNTDLIVALVDMQSVSHVKTYGTDYSVLGAGVDAGGTVTFTVSPTAGYSVVILRDPAKTQVTSYSNNDPFSAKTTEGALDNLTMIAQRLSDQASRTVRLSDYDTAGDMTLPVAASRANQVFRFDANGLPRMAPPTEDSTVLAQDYADQAAASLADFKTRYIGQFANDAAATTGAGGAPTQGQIYEDTTLHVMKFFDGALWQPFAGVADKSVTEPKVADALANTLPAVVASQAAMRALDTARWQAAHYDRDVWKWNSADLSSKLVLNSGTTTAVASSVCTIANHDFYAYDPVIVTAAVNGLSTNTVYYIIRVGKDTFKLASSFANAKVSTAVTLTGTTNFTIKRLKDVKQACYIIKTGAALDGSAGAWVRQYRFLDDRMFGTTYDGVADDLESLQAAIGYGEPFWLLEGRHRITSSLNFDDYTEIFCVSDRATIYCTASVDIFRGRKALGLATAGNGERNFQFRIHGGLIESDGHANAFNFLSTSDARVYGTRGYNLNVWAKNGGSGSQGAFYNEFHDCEVTSIAVTAYQNGTLGNAIKVIGGRVTSTQLGTDDDDNSDNTYDMLSIETFTVAGHRVSNSGSAAQSIASIRPRLENPSTSAPYASAVAVNIAAAGQAMVVAFPTLITVATSYADSGSDTCIIDPFNLFFRFVLPTSAPSGGNRLWKNGTVVNVT